LGLTLQPILFVSDGQVPVFQPEAPGVHVIQYEVVGLPPKRSALISKRDGRWQILRVQDNVPDAWRGSYESPQAALAALAAEMAP
jgi:hypothetical protein